MAQLTDWKNNPSLDYFIKRQDEYFKSELSSMENSRKRLEDYFSQTRKSIDDQINVFYSRYASENGITNTEAKKRADRIDIQTFYRSLNRLKSDKVITDNAKDVLGVYELRMNVTRLELLKMNIDLEVIKLYSDLENEFDRSLIQEAKTEYQRISDLMGVPVNGRIEHIQSLSRSDFHGAVWSERVWGKEHAAKLRSELGRMLNQVTSSGKNPRIFAKELSKVFGTSTKEADKLLNTESKRLNTLIHKDGYTKIGIAKYHYYAEPSACSICAALDGQTFKVSDMQPGINAKPMHPYCYCGILPASTRDEWLASLEERGL